VIVRSIPSSWLVAEQHRLDCGPFTSGRIEARNKLATLRTDPLRLLTRGGMAGMYHVGMDKLRWVNDKEQGVPFLTSSDILLADLSHQPLISTRQVDQNPLFSCPPGTTLITRSGTIGRLAYARPEIAGMAISQDVLKVVPDSSRVPAGYLYAFLSTRFGVPLIVGGTFGSIIVHIEAEDIAELPVPRLGDRLEGAVHELVERAAQAREKANTLLANAQLQLRHALGIDDQPCALSVPWTQADSCWLADRLDAYYYSARCSSARHAFDGARNSEPRRLSAIAEVVIPGIFKRRYADDRRFGVPYITGADVFQLAPASSQYLQGRVAEAYGLVVRRGMILVQEAGQLGGLIGRSVLVGSYLDGFAVSNNMIRITANESADSGYLFALLSSDPGVVLISREAAGSSIPHIDANRVRRIEVPWASKELRTEIGAPVLLAWSLRDEACAYETEARSLVERAIEEAA
jgi:type I restriction enzyme S subunit